MTEHSNPDSSNHHAQIKQLETELHVRYEEQVSAHQSHDVIQGAVSELSAHPLVTDSTDTLEYIEAPQVEHEAPETLKEVHTAAAALVEGFDALNEAHGSAEDIHETPQWRHMFELIATYDSALAFLNWKSISKEEVHKVFHEISKVEAANMVSLPGSFDLKTIDKLLVERSIPIDVLTEQYHYKGTSKQTPESYLQYTMMMDSRQLDDLERAKLLLEIYGTQTPLDTIPVGQDPVVDRLRRNLGDARMTNLSIEARPKGANDAELAAYDERMYQRMDRMLIDELGLSENFVDRYYFAAITRFSRPINEGETGPRNFNGAYIKERLYRVEALMKEFDPEHIDELAHDMGLVNLDRYNSSTLLNLYDIMSDDPEAVSRQEYLRQGDVTVVFVDAFGDYNGAFDTVGSQFGTQDKRTILFEISAPEEIYRRMAQLKNLGIKPTNLVMAAHGSPGSTGFGKGSVKFSLITNEEVETSEGEQRVNLNDANIARLMSDEFMRSDAEGKRRIILDSCSSAVEKEEIVSVAETILRKTDRTDTMVYASDAVSYTRGTMESGLKYIDATSEKQKSSLAVLSLSKIWKNKVSKRSIKELKVGKKAA